MHIHKIHIENLRGFGAGKEAVELDLTRPDGTAAGWTVIAGVNGSGKTTFLRALALSTAALSAAMTLDESYTGWLRQGATSGHTKALVTRSPGDVFKPSRDKVARSQPSSFWTGLRWTADREPMLEVMDELNPKGSRHAPPAGPCAERPLGWFIAGYGPFRRITGEAPAAQRLMGSRNRGVARLVSLFREDASLVECVRWLQQVDYRSKEKRPEASKAEALKQDVLRFLGAGLLPDGAKVDRVDSEGLWVIRDGIPLLHTQLSDGYRTITALVLDILKNLHDTFGTLGLEAKDSALKIPHHGVVLVDEIDAHLHVSWQKRIGFWLKERFPNIQFIVTTHSPFICQAADPKGLIRLAAPGERRPAAAVSEDIYHTVVNGSADDAVMTELFGRERPFSDESEQLREDISDLEARVIEGDATKADKERLKELSARLPKTPSAEVERALRRLSNQLDPRSRVKR